AAGGAPAGGDEPSGAPARCQSADAPPPGGGAMAPTAWPTPEERLLWGETRDRILEAIKELPPQQREVVTLRDVEGWSSKDVCNALEISESNQRVLLHRARSKVRAALEGYFGAMEPNPAAQR